MGLKGANVPLNDHPEDGVTLVEVMVTLFVIALATGAIMMSMPKSLSPLEHAEMRVEQFVSQVFENAQLRSQNYTISIEDSQLILREKIGEEDARTIDTLNLPEDVRGEQMPDPNSDRPAAGSRDALIGPHLDVFTVGFMETGTWRLSYWGGADTLLQINADGSVTKDDTTGRNFR